MQEADRDKIVKLLRMFSSHHDGEVCNAARLAHEFVKKNELDWSDIVTGPKRSDTGHKESQYKRPRTQFENIKHCQDFHN